jgi:hypothetical protein
MTLSCRAADVDFADGSRLDEGRQHLAVDAAARDDREARTGALLVRAQASASCGDRSLAAARKDPIDASYA